MSQLDWQKDQDASWNKELDPRPAAGRPPWRWYLLVFIGLLSLVAGAYLLVTGRGSQIETTAGAEVLGAHRLVEQARARQDPELLELVLAGNDLEWAATQRILLQQEAYYDRPAFGLRQAAVLTATAELSPTVTVGPNLARAEVVTVMPYEADGGQRLRLLQTAFYRRRAERWLLSAPGHDFWGRRANYLGRRILVTYPGRDAALARRLGADLDVLLADLCRTWPEPGCPDDLYLRLTLETGPQAIRSAELWRLLANGLQLRLPAPTWVGLPLDEPGYQALRRGYARQVLTAVTGRLTGYRCCRHGPYYRALLDEQLARHGLANHPLAGKPSLPSESGLTLSAAGRYWGVERVSLPLARVWPAYALVAFLVGELQVDPAQAQQLLASGGGLGYWQWLQQLAGPIATNRRRLERRWQQFVETNFADVAVHPSNPGAPPLALEQNLYLLCRQNERPATLYHYDLATETLTPVRSLTQSNAFLIGLADDRGVVLAERGPLAGPSESLALRTTTNTIVWTQTAEWLLSRSAGDVLPVAWLKGAQGPAELLIYDRGRREYGQLDPAACQKEAGCAWESLGGAPIVGPDGQQVLITPGGAVGYESRFRRPIVVGNLDGELLGSGQAPFWIDARTVGYLADEGQALLAVNVDGSLPRRLLAATALIGPALAAARSGAAASFGLQPVRLEYAAAHPQKPGVLLLAAALAGGDLYLFDFEPATGDLELQAATAVVLDPNTFYNYGFSPDERWMVIGGYDFTSRTASLHLHPLRPGETRTIQFNASFDLPYHWVVDWSADGRWLSVPDSGFIRLVAPDHDFQKLVAFEDISCSAAAWTEP